MNMEASQQLDGQRRCEQLCKAPLVSVGTGRDSLAFCSDSSALLEQVVYIYSFMALWGLKSTENQMKVFGSVRNSFPNMKLSLIESSKSKYS